MPFFPFIPPSSIPFLRPTTSLFPMSLTLYSLYIFSLTFLSYTLLSTSLLSYLHTLPSVQVPLFFPFFSFYSDVCFLFPHVTLYAPFTPPHFTPHHPSPTSHYRPPTSFAIHASCSTLITPHIVSFNPPSHPNHIIFPEGGRCNLLDP